MKVLQCGYGNIGKVLYNEFSYLTKAVNGSLDVFWGGGGGGGGGGGNLDTKYDITFVCVPTDKKDDGSANIDSVLEVCEQVNSEIIVIKSTIPVNIIDKLPENAIYSPEFTGTTPHSCKQDFVILGGRREFCNKVASLYKHAYSGDFHIHYTDIKTAIIAKYAENCFLATKVTFFNEIAQACKIAGVEYDDVRNLLLADSRINPSHTFVYEEQPYYDSHCLNKDIPAFIAQFDLPLMKSIYQINNNMKKFKDRCK